MPRYHTWQILRMLAARGHSISENLPPKLAGKFQMMREICGLSKDEAFMGGIQQCLNPEEPKKISEAYVGVAFINSMLIILISPNILFIIRCFEYLKTLHIGHLDAKEQLAMDSPRYVKLNEAQEFIYNTIGHYRLHVDL